MKTISHNYPKPLSIEAQEWGTLYTKWVKAKLSGDYKLADTLRGWAEFYHGETFVKNSVNKNAPRLRGALLDVIPRQLNGIQLLDGCIVAKGTQNTYLTPLNELAPQGMHV